MDDVWRWLGAELIRMAGQDAALGEELARDGSLFDGYHPRMEALQVQNAARLHDIVDIHGWPGRSYVGEADDLRHRREAMTHDRERPSADPAARRRRHEDWLRRVGWR